VDSGVGSGEFLQTGHELFSFSQASRCEVAAVVVVVAVGGTRDRRRGAVETVSCCWGVVGVATEIRRQGGWWRL
jgi:hypothetical protein